MGVGEGPETLTETAPCRAEDVITCWNPEIHPQGKGWRGIKPAVISRVPKMQKTLTGEGEGRPGDKAAERESSTSKSCHAGRYQDDTGLLGVEAALP